MNHSSKWKGGLREKGKEHCRDDPELYKNLGFTNLRD